MEEITVRDKNNLPATREELAKFVLVGRENLAKVRTMIRAIDRADLAKDVYKQKLAEGQDIADAVLDAEVRLGEIFASLPKAKNQYESASKCGLTSTETKEQALINDGFSKQVANKLEQLHKHPEAVERAKEKARKEHKLVSRADVEREIKKCDYQQKKQERINKQMSNEDAGRVDIFNTYKKYRVIYADPPWQYNDKQDAPNMAGAEKHYPTMPLEDICDLPIPAKNNSVLFLWATSPLLPDAFEVIKAWGFTYKTSFVWDKVKHGMGHYNSVRHELLLIAVKGSCTPDSSERVDSVQTIERTEHSKKPEEFRQIIDLMYPSGNRLEMFARRGAAGWDVWGNMV